jgi:ATP-dependent helicase HrpB
VDALPIDPLLPGIVDTVRRTRRLVLEAPPGAGKTTRVPSALLDAGVAGGRDVVVLQPRRLAARMAARRVADERGERPATPWASRSASTASAARRACGS